jgi:predicted nucleic acid-binding protein
MSYLLDTCVLSELRKKIPEKTHAWFEGKDPDLFYLSAVTIAELWDGIERLPNSKKRKDLEDWFFGDIHTRFKDLIISIDDRVAKEWGSLNAQLLKKGISIGVQDLYIAATAKSFGLELITLNTKDFIAIDIPIVNPWEQ